MSEIYCHWQQFPLNDQFYDMPNCLCIVNVVNDRATVQYCLLRGLLNNESTMHWCNDYWLFGLKIRRTECFKDKSRQIVQLYEASLTNLLKAGMAEIKLSSHVSLIRTKPLKLLFDTICIYSLSGLNGNYFRGSKRLLCFFDGLRKLLHLPRDNQSAANIYIQLRCIWYWSHFAINSVVWKKFKESLSCEIYFPTGDNVEVEIHIEVNKSTAAALNRGDRTLDATLILRLDNETDYYISFDL